MQVGLVQVQLNIGESGSLKGKRKVLMSIKDRLRDKFNVAVAEVGELDKWQAATLAIVTVGNEKRFVNSVLDKVMDEINSTRNMHVVDYRMEIY